MRGKDGGAYGQRAIYGITPAYAGKSLENAVFHAEYRDHPRVCGEKGRADGPGICISGSPPRMRGKDSEGIEI